MKLITPLPLLVTLLLAALMIFCPVASRAADHGADSRRELAAEPADNAPQCPTTHSAAAADCTGADTTSASGDAMLKAESAGEPGCRTGDPSGTLLEDLVSQGPVRQE